MNDFGGYLKKAAKRVRPLLIPALRFCIRYAPHPAVRRYLWQRIVAPFFQYARYDFVATTAFGSVIAGNTEDIIQRYIYYFGAWEPYLTRFLRDTLKEGDLFVDIGANIGYFTLQASQLVGKSGKVVSFEASPKIYAVLAENIKRNNAANVETHNLAISNVEGTTKIFAGNRGNIGETTMLEQEGFELECEVAARPLDVVIPTSMMAKVRLIKVDVEGAEWLVVSGMRSLLRASNADLEIVIEISPARVATYNKCAQDILDVFSEFGFFAYRLDNDYSAAHYLAPLDDRRPSRISPPIVTQTDVIFSRRDVARL